MTVYEPHIFDRYSVVHGKHRAYAIIRTVILRRFTYRELHLVVGNSYLRFPLSSRLHSYANDHTVAFSHSGEQYARPSLFWQFLQARKW